MSIQDELEEERRIIDAATEANGSGRAQWVFDDHARTALPLRNAQVQAALKVLRFMPENDNYMNDWERGRYDALCDIRRAIEEAG